MIDLENEKAGAYNRLVSALHRLKQDMKEAHVDPPRNMPQEMIDEFLLGGKSKLLQCYLNDKPKPGTGSSLICYYKGVVEAECDNIMNGIYKSYGNVNDYLHSALRRYPVKDRACAIIGSTYPQFESFVLSYGGIPLTVEYNVRFTTHESLLMYTPDQFESSDVVVDAALSISSLEHDGLGRYGDPINPDSDLESIIKLKRKVVKGGLLFLSVPVGIDTVVWNAHRIYGRHRLPLLLKHWTLLSVFPDPTDLCTIESGHLVFSGSWDNKFPISTGANEWLFVLQND